MATTSSAPSVGDLVKVSEFPGVYRVLSVEGRTVTAIREVAGTTGKTRTFDTLDITHNAGQGASHDDGKLPVALSRSSERLERQLTSERQESTPSVCYHDRGVEQGTDLVAMVGEDWQCN